MVIIFIFLSLTSVTWAATYTVTKTADTNDGSCDSDCSLREAVAAANSNSGTDTIEFNIPFDDPNYDPSEDTWTITLGSGLTISTGQNIIIDGSTQTGVTDFPDYGGKIVIKNTTEITNIYVYGGSDLTVSRITFYDTTITGHTTIKGSYGSLSIQNCFFKRTSQNTSNHEVVTGSASGNVIFSNNKCQYVNRCFSKFYANGSDKTVTIDSNLLINPDSMGILLYRGYNVSITNNTINGCSDEGIVLPCNGGTCTISNNRIDDSSSPCGYWASMVFYAGGGRFLVSDNYINSGNTNAIRMDTEGIISNNTILGGSGITTTGRIRVATTSAVTIQNNTISGNGIPIWIASGGPTRITNNSITSSLSYTPINLSGGTENSYYVTANDSGDTDTGANDLMNYPVLKKVVKDGNNLIVTADLDFNSSEAPFTIEVFDNDSLNSSGYGGGQYFVGSTTTSSIGSNVTLTIPITGRTPTTASYLTATATNNRGSTSEFSTAPLDTTLYSPGLPNMSFNNNFSDNFSSGENGKLRLSGTASSDQYSISSVEYSVNGSSWLRAIPKDGSFDYKTEEFYFDFDPSDNNNNSNEGYTIKIRAKNLNDYWSGNVLFFSPFDLHSPLDNALLNSSSPSFEFSVNKKQHDVLRDNLSYYQILVKHGGAEIDSPWETLIDNIPVDFKTVKADKENKQKDVYGHLDTNNGIYETDKFLASYSEESSKIKVYPKDKNLSGTYQWKVVAIDKAGHKQETAVRNFYVKPTQGAVNNSLPLTVLHILSLGNPFLSTFNLGTIKDTYYTSSANPIFYGITLVNSKVILQLTEQNCLLECTKTYSTTTNSDSRFGINIPKGDLKFGKKYTAKLAVIFEGKYNELPTFTLVIGGFSPLAALTETLGTTSFKDEIKGEVSPTLTPMLTLRPTPTPLFSSQSQKNKKFCFLFICF